MSRSVEITNEGIATKQELWAKQYPTEYELCKLVCASCLGFKCDSTGCALYGYHDKGDGEYFAPPEALTKFCAEVACKNACSRYSPIAKVVGRQAKPAASNPHNPHHFCRRCGDGLIPNKNWAASNARRNNRICTKCDGARKSKKC